jgi:hypothetical protein
MKTPFFKFHIPCCVRTTSEIGFSKPVTKYTIDTKGMKNVNTIIKNITYLKLERKLQISPCAQLIIHHVTKMYGGAEV